MIISQLFHFADKTFTWAYASLQALTIRNVTSSQTAIDSAGMVTPGGFTGRTLTRRLATFVDYNKDNNQLDFDINSYVCVGYDNGPTKRGYKPKTSSETKREVQNGNASIFAALLAFSMYGKVGSINLQQSRKYSPKNDNITHNPDGRMTDEYKQVAYQLHLLTTYNIDGEDCQSEFDCLQTEIHGNFNNRLMIGDAHMGIEGVLGYAFSRIS